MALEVTCPGPEAALALVGAARRLGIVGQGPGGAQHRPGGDPRRRRDRARCSPGSVRTSRCWPGRTAGCAARCAPRPTGWPTSTTPTCAARPGPRSPPAPGWSGRWRSSATTSPNTSGRPACCGCENKQASLEELGQLHDPPLTKDAVAGRIRRLLATADKRAAELGIPNTEASLSAEMLERSRSYRGDQGRAGSIPAGQSGRNAVRRSSLRCPVAPLTRAAHAPKEITLHDRTCWHQRLRPDRPQLLPRR